ncbi:calcium-binding protein [Azospirillum endophyticum]
MARLVASGSSALSTDSIGLSSLLYGTITTANSNFISVNYGGGGATEFYGSFSYDSSGRNIAAGTLNAVREFANGSLLYTLDGMSISAPVFVGWVTSGQTATARSTILAGSDALYGSDYSDTLRGYAGNDMIYGGGGNDLLDGGSGVNYIDGGAGDADVVVRSSSRSSSTVVNYGGGIFVGDSSGYDQLANVEYIRFSDQTISTSSAPTFNPLSYLAANPDIAAALGMNQGAALNHYLTAGAREQRSATFNVDGYLAANPDLAAAFGANTTAATQHYITAGRLEGRNTSFNVMSYIAANPDLISVFGTNTTAAALHYATAGRLEGRPTTFNTAAYLARNPDVQRALGTSELAAATHYVTAGYREGRSAAPLATTGTRSAMATEPVQQTATLAAGW